MWIILALLSAFFAGITSILAKCGIRKTDSTFATAIRTGVVLIMSVFMVLIAGSFKTIGDITFKTWLFLILSGLATGASWLCYFKALQLGDVNKVVPIDKSSVVLTLVFASIFLGEPMSFTKGCCIVLIAAGTYMMIERKRSTEQNKGVSWLIWALLSAVFASLTSILGKIGIDGVESNLGTAIRTAVVLVMAWIVVFAFKKHKTISSVKGNELLFIILSGLATGASWLCYYKSLQSGITSTVVCIDKLSILFTALFSYLVFKEKLTLKSLIGLIMITAATLGMIFL